MTAKLNQMKPNKTRTVLTKGNQGLARKGKPGPAHKMTAK